MEEPHDRLKQARIKAGFSSGRGAASALGIPPATYAAHENGSRKFKLDEAIRYADFFRVPVEWVLIGNKKLSKPVAVAGNTSRVKLFGFDDEESSISPPLDRRMVRIEHVLPDVDKDMDEFELLEGFERFNLHVKHRWSIPRAMLTGRAQKSERLIMFDVVDTAMSPKIGTGDAVLVDVQAGMYLGSGVYLVNLEGQFLRVRKVSESDNALFASGSQKSRKHVLQQRIKSDQLIGRVCGVFSTRL